MQRYFGINKKDNNILLDKEDYHHIKNVIRHKEDDLIIVNYEDKSYLCKLNNDLLSATIIKEEKYIDNLNVHLYIPILSDNKMTFVIEKAVELGVNEITPIMLNKCKFGIPKDKQNKKKERWEKIIKEASMQCGRINIPKINDIITKEKVNKEKYNIICSLDSNGVKRVNEVLNNAKACDIIQVVFGPEGGFTKEEEEYFVNIGFSKTTLGSRTLRCETAPIVVLSIINYLLEEE